MKNTLVNLSGLPDHGEGADMAQEHVNGFVEDFVQHKGANFATPFIREVVSPNLLEFQRLRDNRAAGSGLTSHNRAHGHRSQDSELKELLKVYAEAELHKHRPGRTFGRLTVDNAEEGYRKLDGGRFRKYADAVLGLTKDIVDEEEADIGEGDNEEAVADVDCETAQPSGPLLHSEQPAETGGDNEEDEEDVDNDDDYGTVPQRVEYCGEESDEEYSQSENGESEE